jgi:site-specific DNA-cytosine methylase
MQNISLSYFAGIGGVSIGAKLQGYKTIGVELDEAIANLYQQNVGECIIADLTTFNPTTLNIPTPQERLEQGIHLVWQLSPPCQEHSLMNHARDPLSERGTILRSVFLHQPVLSPEVIWLENVKGYRGATVYKDFCKLLKSQGYFVWDGIVDFSRLGVPQTRERLIMMASKFKPLKFIYPQAHIVTWYEAIADLIPTLVESQLTPSQLKFIKDKDIPKPFLISRVGHYNKTPKIALAKEQVWTIKAAIGTDDKGSNRTKYINLVTEDGVLSLNTQSLARFQTLPDWCKWSGESALDVKVIGNAVPVLASQYISKLIKRHLATI